MLSKVKAVAVLFVFLLSAGMLAEGAMPVVQPKDIPGKFTLTPQPFPPLADIIAAAVPDRPVYGLYIWAEEYRTLREEIRKIGWKQIRVGGPWDDATMRMVVEDDVEAMLVFGEKSRTNFKSDEEFLAACVRSIEKLLNRYGPGGSFFKDNPGLPVRPITALEIWNEPNFQYMIPDRQPQAEVEKEREALYAKLLPAAAKTIKTKWPEVRVVGFGAGGASAGDLRFIKNVIKKDPKLISKSFDILSTHPYVCPVPPETDAVQPWGSFSVSKSLAIIRTTLGSSAIPVWYTELGWDVSHADGGYYKTNDSPRTDPKLQAAYICRMYSLALRLGVGRVHVMHAFDTDNCNFGFFMHNKTWGSLLPGEQSWRPSSHAVRNMIKLMPFPKLARAVNDGKDDWYAWTFNPDARSKAALAPVTMVYCVSGPKKVEIDWNAPAATLVDMLGTATKINAKPEGEGKWKLPVEIGPCPVYLTAADK